MKVFTLAEVAAHNTRDDLYMIIRDEVYEVSKFVTEVSETGCSLIYSVADNFVTNPLSHLLSLSASR